MLRMYVHGCFTIGVLTLTEPLDHDHVIHTFLDAADLQQAEPASTLDGSHPWWGDGGSIAPEVGLLTHNIVIQGICIHVATVQQTPH